MAFVCLWLTGCACSFPSSWRAVTDIDAEIRPWSHKPDRPSRVPPQDLYRRDVTTGGRVLFWCIPGSGYPQWAIRQADGTMVDAKLDQAVLPDYGPGLQNVISLADGTTFIATKEGRLVKYSTVKRDPIP